MSLKKLVIFLLFANLAYFGYSQGWFGAWREGGEQREPERIGKQVNPDAIKISPAPAPVETAPAEAPATAPATIAEATTPAQIACTGKREQWMVYMGAYTSKALLDKKKAELNTLGVDSQSVSKPTLKLGLSLGEYESEASAREALARLATKGVKTATVVLWAILDCPAR